MKNLFMLLLFIGIVSCDKPDINRTTIEVAYKEDLCCAQLLVLDGQVRSPHVDYRHDRLFAFNIDEFVADHNLSVGDKIKIKIEYTDQGNPCLALCNIHQGIPVYILKLVE